VSRGRKVELAEPDLEALVLENVELRDQLRRRKRRVALRRVRRYSPIVIAVARAIARKRAGDTTQEQKPPAKDKHAGAVHALIFALVARRIVAEPRTGAAVTPAPPQGGRAA
jgi:hypothetical protein